MALTRRNLLKAGLGAGALLVARPLGVLASGLGPAPEFGTSRQSRLHPGLRVAHGDLHNHSHLSDGSGDPTLFFESVREGGIDVAALTDHSTLSWGPAGEVTEVACGPVDGEPQHGSSMPCRSVTSIDEERWQETIALAAAADDPGAFTAIHGFEWSSPFLGHVNVWFSERWIDPLHTAGGGPEGLGEWAREIPGAGPHLGPQLDAILRAAAPSHGHGMQAFYEWLNLPPDTPGIGGGSDGIASFNHPGREPGRFGYFRYFPEVAHRFVAMEILNRRDDYLFEAYANNGQPSPLVDCLNAGWRVGLTGVTDEHSPDWGDHRHLGKGRAGLWLDGDLSRGTVRAALEQRRVFATFLAGLRLDATLASGAGLPGDRVQMGRGVAHGSGPATFAVDIDRGPDWVGKQLEIQVLRPADDFPQVAHVEEVTVPAPEDPLIEFTVPLDRDDGDWVVLRIADPEGSNNQQGPEGHRANNYAVGYTSPWWLDG